MYAGTYSHKTLGIDWKSGKIVWTYADPDREFPIMSSAAVTPEAIFVGGRDKRLRSISTKKGELLWSFVTRGRVDSSPVVVGDRVFVASADGTLYAVERATGKERWRFETGAPISASPAVAAGRLVIGNEDGMVYCFGPPSRTTREGS